MTITCSIMIVILAMGGIPFQVKTDAEGKILKEGDTKYLADFSKDVSKYNLAGKPSDYSKVLVNKEDCVK